MGLVRRARRGFAVGAVVLALSGCSVYMSANRQSYRGDPTVLKVGADRNTIEAALGAADQLVTLDNGKTRAVYKIDPNAATAVNKGVATGFNTVADIFTIGLWEVVATPIELASADKITNYVVTYGADDKVEAVETFK
jgi:hypothetical protein